MLKIRTFNFDLKYFWNYRVSSYSFRPWIVSAPLCTVTFAFPKRIFSAETILGNTVFKFKVLIRFFGHAGPVGPMGPGPFLSADLYSFIFVPMSWKIHNRYCHTAEVRNLHYLWTFSQVLWLQHSIWGKWVFVFLATCIFTRFFFL